MAPTSSRPRASCNTPSATRTGLSAPMPLRALAAIAVYAGKQPDRNIRIAPTWLVEMLHSIVLEDRLQAARALVVLTDSPNAGALDLIRARALDSLKEMARWTTLRYALPAFLLLGRVAGMPDGEIHAQWENGDRESVIEKALALDPGNVPANSTGYPDGSVLP